MTSQLYLESPQHLSKKSRTQLADRRNLERVVAFLGASRDVATLSESDVRRYTLARRQGDPSLKGVAPGKPVRDRAIELDLVLLMTALNCAARERTSTGRRLLRENPLTGVRLPKEKNPERPVMSHGVYLKLLEVAPRVHPLLPLALIVDGVTLAATGAIAGAVLVLGRRALVDLPTVLICAVTLGLVVRMKDFPEPVLIGASGVVGVLLKGAL